ncbi:MAG: right-handed parallel beta-helix repeat-containing protein [Myxococcales bacterium]|nr:right-handed parallel beta-helix repeat-containing protein [Myxococcales bacterium]
MTREHAYRHGRIALWLAAITLGAACDAGTSDPITLPTELPPPGDETVDPCLYIQCANDSTCRVDGSNVTCDCLPGFTGQRCEVNIDDCPANACENGGVCVDQVNAYICSCPPGITGERCEIDQDLRLTVPRRMANDKPITLRAELLDPSNGSIVTEGCFDTLGSVSIKRADDGTPVPLTVTIFDDHVPVPDDSLRFYHGVGSVSLTLDGGAAVPAGEYLLTVNVGQRTATRRLTIESSPNWRVMPATLSGADLTWGPDENIRLSAHNTVVPAGSTLTIHPGTLIMVDTTGGREDGTLLTINGNLNATGTIERPVHFFSTRGASAMTHTVSGTSLSNPNSWRGIFFYGNQSSTLDWVILSGAGNGPLVSHPRPPIINLANTHSLTVQDSIFADATGMVFQSPSTGTSIIRRSLVSRVGIGAEFLSSGNNVLIEDSWWTAIGRGPTEPLRYDGDGIHVDGANSKQTIRRCFIVDIGDDAIDHSNSTFTVEDTVIHDAADKAISMTNGAATIRNSLIYKTGSGVRGTARVYNSTILSPSPIATPQTLLDSIIWPNSLSSCDGDVRNSILGTGSDLSCGTGNMSVNPRFVNPAQCDYHLAVGSPALTASSIGGPIGWGR